MTTGGVRFAPVAAGTYIAGAQPESVVFAADGRPWAALPAFNRLIQPASVGDSNIAASIDYPASTQPQELVLGPDGDLWVVPRPDGAIWFTENGTDMVGRLGLDAAQAGGPGAAPGAVADTAAPLFTKALSVSRSRFRASAAARRSTPRGSAFRFSLSEPARVVITIAKRSSGRRVGGRCVKAMRSNRRRSRCTRYATVGTLRREGRQGGNEVAFSGRVDGRKLRGTYRASAVATDGAGNVSKPSHVAFTVVSG